jgi:hypothetical protein
LTKANIKGFPINKIISVTAGENLTDKDYCFIAQPGNTLGYTAGRAYKCDSTNESLSVKNPLRGFNVSGGAVTSGNSFNLQIAGNIALSGLNLGQYYFISTSGTLTNALNADYRYLVGICKTSGYLFLIDETSMSSVNLTSISQGKSKGYFSSSVIDKITSDTSCAAISATLSNEGTAGATLGGYVYFAGGYNIGKLNDETSCTNVTANLSVTRTCIAGGNLSSSAYFAGGAAGGVFQNMITKFVTDSSASTISATISVSRYNLAGAQLSSSVYFAGGTFYSSGYNYVNNIDKLTSDSSCTAVAVLANRPIQLAGAGYSSSAYFVGGRTTIDQNGGQIATINKLTNDTSYSSASFVLTKARCAIGGVSVGSYIFIAGGNNYDNSYNNYFNIIDKIDGNDIAWMNTKCYLSSARNVNCGASI